VSIRRLICSTKTHRDRGAAAVEFALVLPILLLVIFGLIDFGRLLNAQVKTTEAAREGARAAAVAGLGDDHETAAENRVHIVDEDITVVSPSTFCEPPYSDDEDATVHTEYEFAWITPVGDIAALFGGSGWGDPITVTGTGVMPCRA
jgi:hypothetical protein